MAAAETAEPSCEPPAASGVSALLRAAAEAALPPIRALLADQGLLPQQALGILSFVADVLNRILVSLSEPEALAKFSRLKLSALRKKVTHKPKHAEAVLKVAGFVLGGDSEHLEWGSEGPEALAAALSVQAVITQVQEVAQTKGVRALTGPLDPECVSVRSVLGASFGGARLLEPRNAAAAPAAPKQANAVEISWLVRRAWLREHLPQLARAQEELPSLFEPAAIFASRERNAKIAVCKAITEARAKHGIGDGARLALSPMLSELAQLAAGAELVRLRKPEMFKPPAPPSTEPDVEPAANGNSSASSIVASPAHDDDDDDDEDARPLVVPSVGAAELIVPALARCVPAFRLGLQHTSMSHILRLSEAPAFFTMDEREKAFQVSVSALGQRIVESWLAKPAQLEALLRPEACALGVGCSLDIGNDDKAIIFAVVG